jgi:ribose/xylose/arabinose/galactoside ABC-type transport system permease subunit
MALTVPTVRRAWGQFRPTAPVWVALGAFVLFSLFVPRFMTSGNLANVLRLASILCIASCGQAIVLILGGIEFSFGSSVALASVVAVTTIPSVGPVASFLVAAAVAVSIGTINGALIAKFDLPPFIVTLGMLMAAAGLAASLVGGQPIDAPPSEIFSWPARGRVAGIPVPILTAAACVIILHLLLSFTRIGRQWFLAGGNAVAARLSGIHVGRTVFFGYFIAGLFCALTGVILTSRVESGQPELAPNLPFETIAACAIGGIPLAGGRGRAYQVVCGVLVIAMMNNAVVLLNLPIAGQYLMIAVIIIGAVLLQQVDRPAKRLLAILRRGGWK